MKELFEVDQELTNQCHFAQRKISSPCCFTQNRPLNNNTPLTFVLFAVSDNLSLSSRLTIEYVIWNNAVTIQNLCHAERLGSSTGSKVFNCNSSKRVLPVRVRLCSYFLCNNCVACSVSPSLHNSSFKRFKFKILTASQKMSV